MCGVRFFRPSPCRNPTGHIQTDGGYTKAGSGEGEQEDGDPRTESELVDEVYIKCVNYGLTPDVFWNLTYGEAVDWLFAAMDRCNTEFDNLKYQAWFNGLAFNLAYVAAKDANRSYPSFEEMFPRKKSDEEIEADEEAQWVAERAEMTMILEANSYKQKPNIESEAI